MLTPLQREVRYRFGTQFEFAKKLGVSESMVSRVLRGHEIPSTGLAQSMEALLGKSLSEFSPRKRRPRNR